MDEIAKNDYNLNISRYVSTSIEEEKLTYQKLIKTEKIENAIAKARDTHNGFLSELGLPACLKILQILLLYLGCNGQNPVLQIIYENYKLTW